MADYGRTTAGASFVDIEVDLQGRKITLPGGESISSTQAYLQTTNASVANVKAALYNFTTLALVYESNQLSVTDDAGGWKTITWPATTPAAGDYYLVVGGGPIGGGANTVNIAYDTVGASTDYIRATSATAATPYPTFPNPVIPDGPGDTHDSSVYLVTAVAGGAAIARTVGSKLVSNPLVRSL
jgi:hypothetical protein